MSSNLPRLLDRYHAAGRRACKARAHDDPARLCAAYKWLDLWGTRLKAASAFGQLDLYSPRAKRYLKGVCR
jgi:hypothetical protein